MKQIIREIAIIAALAEALGYEDLTDLADMITEEETARLVEIAKSVPETDVTEEITLEAVRELIRESIDRLLALGVMEPGAEETGN